MAVVYADRISRSLEATEATVGLFQRLKDAPERIKSSLDLSISRPRSEPPRLTVGIAILTPRERAQVAYSAFDLSG